MREGCTYLQQIPSVASCAVGLAIGLITKGGLTEIVAGFVGMGIGAAMIGLRPVVELMFWSFAYVAFDQIINNAGCTRYMSGGLMEQPNKPTAHASQNLRWRKA